VAKPRSLCLDHEISADAFKLQPSVCASLLDQVTHLLCADDDDIGASPI
jgi:hypothetical protein